MESKMVLEAAVKAVTIQNSTNLFLYVVGADCYKEESFYNWLVQKLPGYMLPKGIVKLDKLPLTIHGKVDKSKLPEWKPAQHDSYLSFTKEENLLLTICNELLPDGMDITVDTNFYALGGDSIKAIQISSRILEYGYELKVSDILTNPVFREMAKHIIKKQVPLENEMIMNKPFTGLPIIQWFFNQHFAEPQQYNQSLVLRLKHNIDVHILEKALSSMVIHHDSLRINVIQENNQLFYNNIHLERSVKIHEIKVIGQGWKNIEHVIWDSIDVSFNLEKELLFRTYLIHANEEKYLLFIFHHLIIDGVSWQIFLHDLRLLLDDNGSGRQSLPNKTISYAKYSKEYHVSYIETETFVSKMPASIPEYERTITLATYGDRTILQKTLWRENSQNLIEKANSLYGTKTHELFVMSLMLVLSDHMNKTQAAFEIELHGRDLLHNIDVSRTIGWFTKIQTVILSISPKELSEQLADMKKQLYHNALKNNNLTHNEIRINYLGDLPETNNSHWIFESFNWNRDVSPYNLWPYYMEANIYRLDGNLHIIAAFNNEWSKQGEKIIACWLEKLEFITRHCIEYKNI